MKDKTPLLLMEQLIMILIFALTAALCLRGFAYAAKLSREIRQQEQAILLAQTAAETLKAERKIRQDIVFYDASLTPVTQEGPWMYRIQISREEETLPGLECARICVDSVDTHGLTELTVGWQEVLP